MLLIWAWVSATTKLNEAKKTRFLQTFRIQPLRGLCHGESHPDLGVESQARHRVVHGVGCLTRVPQRILNERVRTQPLEERQYNGAPGRGYKATADIVTPIMVDQRMREQAQSVGVPIGKVADYDFDNLPKLP